jgi:type I restriction enzyme S subunit
LEPNGIQNSPIGPISADWQYVRLDEVIVNSAYGPRFPGSKYSPEGNVRTIRTTDFDRIGGISFVDVPAADLDDETVTMHRLVDGDFLLSRSGEYAGLTATFNNPNNGENYIPGAFLIRYRFDKRLVPEYLLALCCSGFGDKFVKPLATGSAQPNISGSAFARLQIPLPPIEEQRRIVDAISRLRLSGMEMIMHQQRSADLLALFINSLC